MKLLITTQIMDRDDQMLGFFEQWVKEFSKHCEEVHVICLKEGTHDLPENVHVYSLGKEGGVSRLKYLWRFFKYIWKLRKNYDAVFAHQNQVYVLLGWLLWRLTGKQIGLWYMHRSVTPSLRIAERLIDYVFTASKESFRIPTRKLHITGHGIDAGLLVARGAEKTIDLFTIGRMVPSKNIEELIETLALLHKRGQPLSLTIAGAPVTKEGEEYVQKLNALIATHALEAYVHFIGAVKHAEVPELLSETRVFVHAATNGSLDKTLLEPLLMNVPVVSSAEGAASLPLGDWQVSGIEMFADRIEEVLATDTREKVRELHDFVAANHTLEALIPKILNVMRATS